MTIKILAIASLALVLGACEETERVSEVHEGRRSSREPTPSDPAPTDPGPQVWRPSGTTPGEALGGTGGGGGGGERRDRPTKRPTKTEIQAQLAGLRQIDGELGACQQAFAALRETRDGMRELLDEDQMGGPNRADYLAVCRAFPAEVQRCMTPSHQAANQESCQRTLARFGADRENPAWLERLSGHPPEERPAPATSEAEARALNRRRQRRAEDTTP